MGPTRRRWTQQDCHTMCAAASLFNIVSGGSIPTRAVVVSVVQYSLLRMQFYNGFHFDPHVQGQVAGADRRPGWMHVMVGWLVSGRGGSETKGGVRVQHKSSQQLTWHDIPPCCQRFESSSRCNLFFVVCC
jgi:hypothetical protein